MKGINHSYRGVILHGKILLLDDGVIAASDGHTHKISQPHVHAPVIVVVVTRIVKTIAQCNLETKKKLTHMFHRASLLRTQKDKTVKNNCGLINVGPLMCK